MHRRKRWVVSLLLGGLVAMLGVQAVRDATAPHPPGRIAVEYHSRSQGTEIYTLAADRGANPRRLTVSSSAANPIWSPDGQRLLFTAVNRDGKRLWHVVNTEGGQPTELIHTGDMGAAAWAPDSQRIVITVLNAREEPSIVLINADGTGLIRLAAKSSSSPAWAPDGQRIAFLADQPTRGIYTITPDGSGLTQLVVGETTRPRWSPDGRTIVFIADQLTPGLFAIHPDGTQLTQLAAGTIDDPQWAPDGQHLAFQQLTQDHWVWMTMRPDGTQIAPLIAGEWLAWSSTGQQLAIYQSGPGEHDVIAVFNADGTDRKDVVTGMLISTPLSWSPDGQWIAFTVVARSSLIMPITEVPKGIYAMGCMYLRLPCARVDLQYQDVAVYAVRADGSNLTLVSQLPGASREPAWQP